MSEKNTKKGYETINKTNTKKEVKKKRGEQRKKVVNYYRNIKRITNLVVF